MAHDEKVAVPGVSWLSVTWLTARMRPEGGPGEVCTGRRGGRIP